MNKDKKILQRLEEHRNAVIDFIDSEDRIVFTALQGSQNYGLDYEDSDIDSKCVIVPTLDDIINNKKPISTTLIMDNEEHCDIKDIRLMWDCYEKQNINFVETLFTKYMLINPLYEEEMNLLLNHREEIARYNPYRAVKCMKGMAYEKRHALQHPYPSKVNLIEEYGYDPKQLHHIVRLSEFLDRYVKGVSYAECLYSEKRDYLLTIKTVPMELDAAIELADIYVKYTDQIADLACQAFQPDEYNVKAKKVLNITKSNIIKKFLQLELIIGPKDETDNELQIESAVEGMKELVKNRI